MTSVWNHSIPRLRQVHCLRSDSLNLCYLDDIIVSYSKKEMILIIDGCEIEKTNNSSQIAFCLGT